MSLLQFLPAQEEPATANQTEVSCPTRKQEKRNEVRSMTPEQQKGKEERMIRETIEDLKARIVQDGYLWDMRCWEKFHDPEEIRAWIRNKCQPNNCGHAVYCIQELMQVHNFSEDGIVELVMQNNGKVFPNRLAKCFHYGNNCPIFKEKGNFSDCNCSERCGGKEEDRGGIPWFL